MTTKRRLKKSVKRTLIILLVLTVCGLGLLIANNRKESSSGAASGTGTANSIFSDDTYTYSDTPTGVVSIMDDASAEAFADSFINALYLDYEECKNYVDYLYRNVPLPEEIVDIDDDHTDNTLSNMLYLYRFYSTQFPRIERVRQDVDRFYYTNQGKSRYFTDSDGNQLCEIEYQRTLHVVSDDEYVAQVYGDGDQNTFWLYLRKTEDGWRLVYLKL